MIKILIGIGAFALATTGQVSLAGTSQVSYSSASNHIILAHGKYSGHDWEKRTGGGSCHKHPRSESGGVNREVAPAWVKCKKTNRG